MLLGLWVFGTLFPLFALRGSSPTFQRWFDWVFQTHASHVLMHAFLYAVMAALLSAVLLCEERCGWRVGLVLAGVTVASVCQEMIQLWTKGHGSGLDERFDLVVNGVGGVLGVLLYMRWNVVRAASA